LSPREEGSAPVEATFAMVLLMVFALGVMQVALVLYGRNVLAASAHEGARAAVELGRGPSDAIEVAEKTVRIAAGGLVDHLEVSVTVSHGVRGRTATRVQVAGVLSALGPVPLPIPVSVAATAVSEKGIL
jgi:hypothetical protein